MLPTVGSERSCQILRQCRRRLCHTVESCRRKPKGGKAKGGADTSCPFFFLLFSLPLSLVEVSPWWTSLVLPGDKVAWERGFDEQPQCNGSSPANTLNTGTDRQTNTCMCANTARSVACGQPEQTATSGSLFLTAASTHSCTVFSNYFWVNSQEILRIFFHFTVFVN